MYMPTSSWRGLPGSSGQMCRAQSQRKRGLLCSRARTICAQPRAAYNDGRKFHKDLSKTAVLAAGILSCLLTAHPAHAQKIWRPRRHHRRIGERYGYNWADPIVAKLEEEERLQQEAERRAAEASRKLQEQKLARKRALREEKRRQRESKQRTEQNIRKAKEAVLSVVTLPRRVGEFVTDYIGVANLAIFLGLLFLLLKFVLAGPLMSLWAGLSGQGWRPRGAGKWVSDRSLGGKLVWVPDVPEGADAAAASSGASAAAPAGGRGALKEADFEELTKVAAVAAKGTAGQASVGAAAAQELPDWWQQDEGARSRGLSEAAMAEKQAAADKLLRGLEKGKVAGQDYWLPNLVKLHSICQEAGCSVVPATVGGRDAMYRAAVEGAIRASADPLRYGRELGGWTPQQLVVGLAGALGLSQDRALKIARSCVAAEMRSKLVEVVAANKRGQDGRAPLLVSLLQLADLQAGLPLLSASSPEVEMIASSLNTRASMEERRALLLIATNVSASDVALFAALFGFDPPQVVPSVIEQLRAQRGDLEAAAGVEGGAQGT